jgi:hypothetical protein
MVYQAGAVVGVETGDRRRRDEEFRGLDPTTMPPIAEEYNILSPEEQRAHEESERNRERDEHAGQSCLWS